MGAGQGGFHKNSVMCGKLDHHTYMFFGVAEFESGIRFAQSGLFKKITLFCHFLKRT